MANAPRSSLSAYETAERASAFHCSMRRHGVAIVPRTSAMSPGWGMSEAQHGPSLDETRASGCRGASPQGASEADPAPGSSSAVWRRADLVMLPLHREEQGALGGTGSRRARSGVPARGAEPARRAARRRRLLDRRRARRGGSYGRRQPAATASCDVRGSRPRSEGERGACRRARSRAPGATKAGGSQRQDTNLREDEVEGDSRDEDDREEDEAVVRQRTVGVSSPTDTTRVSISIGVSSESS